MRPGARATTKFTSAYRRLIAAGEGPGDDRLAATELAAYETDGADLTVSARWANADLDIAAEAQQNAHEAIRREAAKLRVE